MRAQSGKATAPFYNVKAGGTLSLPGKGKVTPRTPYSSNRGAAPKGHYRLWIAMLSLPCRLEDYLAHYGFPIRYSYVKEVWPIDYYQSVYVTEVGSAEMPSVGRAFTPELITKLVAHGVQVAPLILHTGVASLETLDIQDHAATW